ncbi:MAG TPA: HAMP domain-containing sensor histidine kinase [Candidatus Nitrosotenuis sp.]|nr:HAMP domain-containing sensor histidine kinase [Candidatus Nitrosotenuis sp.]
MSAPDDAARLIKNAQEEAARLIKNAQEEARGSPRIEKRAFSDEMHVIRKNKLYTIGELSSRLAHDLQNPLAIIKNTLEILRLRDPKLDAKTEENYDRIDRAVTRMQQQINDVLDFVRTGYLIRGEISVCELLKTVVEDMDVPKEILITLPSQDAKIFVDLKQMQTVFANLVLNAIQAIDGKGKISIQLFDSDNDVVIEVIDDGHGIKKEDLQHIFEPLFTTKQSGTGLGLASCKAVIESHGGTISCTSIVGKGTVFTIKLPKA